jgi:hypothetical protein
MNFDRVWGLGSSFPFLCTLVASAGTEQLGRRMGFCGAAAKTGRRGRAMNTSVTSGRGLSWDAVKRRISAWCGVTI